MKTVFLIEFGKNFKIKKVKGLNLMEKWDEILMRN